jgi:hypothetical protein
LKSIIYLVCFAGFLSACNQRDEAFCTCLTVGEELNEFSSDLLLKDNITSEDNQKMQALKEKKEKACKAYETMSGEEMLKKKATCGLPEEELH